METKVESNRFEIINRLIYWSLLTIAIAITLIELSLFKRTGYHGIFFQSPQAAGN
jgi:hypothetical protein